MSYQPINPQDLTTDHLGHQVRIQLHTGKGITGSLRQLRIFLEDSAHPTVTYDEAVEVAVGIQDLEVPIRLEPNDSVEVFVEEAKL